MCTPYMKKQYQKEIVLLYIWEKSQEQPWCWSDMWSYRHECHVYQNHDDIQTVSVILLYNSSVNKKLNW